MLVDTADYFSIQAGGPFLLSITRFFYCRHSLRCQDKSHHPRVLYLAQTRTCFR